MPMRSERRLSGVWRSSGDGGDKLPCLADGELTHGLGRLPCGLPPGWRDCLLLREPGKRQGQEGQHLTYQAIRRCPHWKIPVKLTEQPVVPGKPDCRTAPPCRLEDQA